MALKRKRIHISKKNSKDKEKMSQDEEKNAGADESWDRDRDVIVRLSERFEVFTAQVIKKMDELLSMRDMVEKLLHRQTSKRSNDAERKRKERCGIAKQKMSDAIELTGNIFDTKMAVMHKKYILWAHVGIQFGIMGSYNKFLAWLCSDWNHWTFDRKPITRVSNRPHLFSRGVRNEATWTDVFGRETGIREGTFFEPMFWEFQHIMVKLVKMMEEMPDWANVHDSFRAHLQVACSGLADTTASGMYKFQDKTPFDHLEQDCSKVPQYRIMATLSCSRSARASPKRAWRTPKTTWSSCAWGGRGRQSICCSCKTKPASSPFCGTCARAHSRRRSSRR